MSNKPRIVPDPTHPDFSKTLANFDDGYIYAIGNFLTIWTSIEAGVSSHMEFLLEKSNNSQKEKLGHIDLRPGRASFEALTTAWKAVSKTIIPNNSKHFGVDGLIRGNVRRFSNLRHIICHAQPIPFQNNSILFQYRRSWEDKSFYQMIISDVELYENCRKLSRIHYELVLLYSCCYEDIKIDNLKSTIKKNPLIEQHRFMNKPVQPIEPRLWQEVKDGVREFTPLAKIL